MWLIFSGPFPICFLYKSIADRYRPVRVADGLITTRYIFIKNASWVVIIEPTAGFLKILQDVNLY